MIILGLLHIWILGALPLLAVSSELFNSDFTRLCRDHGLGDWTAAVIWAGIISLFYIIVFCFTVGALYLHRQTDSPLGSRRHLVLLLALLRGTPTSRSRPVLAAVHGVGTLIFIIVATSLYLQFLVKEQQVLWLVLFHLSLALSTLGCARFFYRNRSRLLAAL